MPHATENGNAGSVTVAPMQAAARTLGLWSSILVAICAAAALSIAVTTAPARSGPFCLTEECIGYPYTDAAAFVPTDYYWMYPAFIMGPLLVLLVASVHHSLPVCRKPYSLVALIFAAISAAALSTNYFVQLTVVQPSLLKGEIEGLTLLSQYNPHGLFIALEDIGYLMMGVAFLFTGAAFVTQTRIERVLRWLLCAAGALAIGLLPVLALIYGYDLEYRYEVAVLLVDWLTLIVAGALFAVRFARIRVSAPDAL